jgi:hypothetical protein
MERLEAMAEETELSARGTTMDNFFLQDHDDLNLRLTGGNTHGLTEACANKILEWDGHISLLEVVD